MDTLNSEGNSAQSSSSEEEYVFFLYTKPEMTLPSFLNSDYKWHRAVVKADTILKYCQLISRTTESDLDEDDKCEIMMIITADITTCHRPLIAHWRLLQSYAFFSNIDIL